MNPQNRGIMKKELNKIYNPKIVEQDKYDNWLSKGYFKPKTSGKPFSIILPDRKSVV